jgi:hypothetical protein
LIEQMAMLEPALVKPRRYWTPSRIFIGVFVPPIVLVTLYVITSLVLQLGPDGY